ncbi:hypothetical protein Aab01nite_63130 [Paractinoplanes abujensis]|uniref:Uncharacterized protein n=1 Tax=Paractinoplanes abujensis TaxID=882441 RepID=A0A7W7CT29_9ACTN|nr:hypothetical protein [Actinoplanes abujensis]MBB4692778.1 hypothetical protein [Actinoplanes abujensis]GID22723.1 hypothetical protein Aab01nite_63130 [Actinoplanes abujensis]
MDPTLQAVRNHSIDVWLDDAFASAPEGTRMLAGLQNLYEYFELFPDGAALEEAILARLSESPDLFDDGE